METNWGFPTLRESGGVCAVYSENRQLWVFARGSLSQGIPRKEWRIPHPIANAETYQSFDIDASADVVVLAEIPEVDLIVRLS